MAQVLSQAFISQLKDVVDIVEIVSRFVNLRKAGKNYVGLCPFHNDTKPSFNVSPERGFYRCFGCGKGGDVISFLMEQEGLTFTEAVRELASQYGLKVSITEQHSELTRLREALRWARDFFVEHLKSGAGSKARQYLKERGFEKETLEEAQLGLAPSGNKLLKKGTQAGFEKEALEKAGLIIKLDDGTLYDRFRNRLIFPIFDIQGRVVGFGGRALFERDEPKYLNSPETPLFHKSRILYGLNWARGAIYREGSALLVEGYTDVLMCRQFGVENVCATLGTALTKENAWQIRRLTEGITMLFDSDEAGIKATERGLEVVLEADLDVRIATLEEGVDPCEFLLSKGAGAFRNRLEASDDLIGFTFRVARKRGLLEDASSKAKVVDGLLSLVPLVPNPVKRELLLHQISEESGIEEPAVRARFRTITSAKRTATEEVAEQLPNAGEELLAVALKDTSTGERIRSCLETAESLSLERSKEILSVVLQSFQEKGKMEISDVLSRFPDTETQAYILRWYEHPVAEPDQVLRSATRKAKKKEKETLLKSLRERARQATDEKERLELLRKAQEIATDRTAEM